MRGWDAESRFRRKMCRGVTGLQRGAFASFRSRSRACSLQSVSHVNRRVDWCKQVVHGRSTPGHARASDFTSKSASTTDARMACNFQMSHSKHIHTYRWAYHKSHRGETRHIRHDPWAFRGERIDLFFLFLFVASVRATYRDYNSNCYSYILHKLHGKSRGTFS